MVMHCIAAQQSQRWTGSGLRNQEGTSELSQDTPRPSSQHKGDLFASEEQRSGSKRQIQEREDEREGEGNKGKRAGVGQRSASG